MALATRCPECQAMFRVVADQLRLRGGLVRCGTCRHVFDAISSLTYVDDATVKSAPAESRESGDAAPIARADTPKAKPAAPAKPKPAARPITLRITPDSGVHAPRVEREPERRDEDRGRTRTPDAGVPTLWVTDVASYAPTHQTTTSAAPTGPAPHENAAGLDAPTDAPSMKNGPARQRRRAATPATEPAADRIAATTAADSDETASTNDAGQAAPLFLQDPRRKRGFSILYGTGALALAAIIALQLAVLFRTELLTRWPALRPTLVDICSAFGCNVGWPTRAELLAVVGTELQAVPGTDVLELTAVIRNRAGFKVAMPAIELTLTDTQNRTLARKVFAPVDYLASSGEPSSRIDEGLGAGSDYTVRIVFEARGLSAVGFVVYPFYL